MELFHIIDQDAWDEAATTGRYRPPSLSSEGFIHLSTEEQLMRTVERFYSDRSEVEVAVVKIDLLDRPLQFEDSYGHGMFPHLYGSLIRDAVVRTFVIQPGKEN